MGRRNRRDVRNIVTEETNTEETNTEETNTEETNAEETNAEETNTEETDTEETNTEETNTEETNIEETNTEETNIEETNTEETNIEEAKVKEAKSYNDDIFVSESDRFSVNIQYYIDSKLNEPMIKGFDETYLSEGTTVKSFEINFKYPSQKDTEIIMSTKNIKSLEEAGISDFIELENTRLAVLIRDWSINKPIQQIGNINPKIIKAIRAKVNELIGANGIF
jgi:hypothetical protein